MRIFENNGSSGNKMEMQRMDSVPNLCINVGITTDTLLKFDANADANVNIDAQCERTFRYRWDRTSAICCVNICFNTVIFSSR